ncbi:stage V sporulation protein AA [Siminovitchia sp. 179-K 8D1 HS]|uniref:stage V sporulation protein AA n=1 Tax=Siminovitchia sp. 179-K 8D1 HS TaxID=3142385 RepID=UPI00399F5FFB
MEDIIYIQMRHRVEIKENRTIRLGDIAGIIAPEHMLQTLNELELHVKTGGENKFIVIDALTVIEKIGRQFPKIEIQTVGPEETIIEFVKKSKTNFPLFIAVWLLLFVGSGLTIMNFHEETSMQALHQKLYWMLTGTKNDRPYLLQIPYSIGLGIGMILFFNHLFKKRINEEPSPLEIEMFNYQQDMDKFVVLHKKKESAEPIDDR